MPYEHFLREESIYAKVGTAVKSIIKNVAQKYVENNPPLPAKFKTFCRRGFLQTSEGRYDINFNHKWPAAQLLDRAFAFGMFFSRTERVLTVSINCFGPTLLFLNSTPAYQSTSDEELRPEQRTTIDLALQPGWNTLLVCCMKVASGFGCQLGSARPMDDPLHIMSPFTERYGQAGWIYSETFKKDRQSLNNLPVYTHSEQQSPLHWYPDLEWNREALKMKPCARLFSVQTGKYAYGWTGFKAAQTEQYLFEGNSAGAITIWLDNSQIFSQAVGGQFQFYAEIKEGQHNLIVETVAGLSDWGYLLKVSFNEVECAFSQPHQIEGAADTWFYLGPFEPDRRPAIRQIPSLYNIFGGTGPVDEQIYWRIDRPETWIRPYIETTYFARWNNALGVLLYGLLATGKDLGVQQIIRYVEHHFTECISMYHYALWDKSQYGYPAINQRLIGLESLADCGAMAAGLLETYREYDEEEIPDVNKVTAAIADFICKKLERKEDGVFFRYKNKLYIDNTLWADDLFPAVLFLLRYYQKTEKKDYINEAVNQALLYKKYLFLPEQKLMAHVYSFAFNAANGIAWGRGNGWVLFSLSEVLAALSEKHPAYSELLGLFNILCEGVLALQGTDGLWYQILTDATSYEETSCTAMFIYAFARGIRFNWLKNTPAYYEAISKAWKGLAQKTIDRQGNVHGIAADAGYSFSPEYYKYDLPWHSNNTQGIGFVILAGIEVIKLKEYASTSTVR